MRFPSFVHHSAYSAALLVGAVNGCLSLRPGSAAAEEPAVVVLHVKPALPPYRALRDRLLPSRIESTAGNAAPLYLQACLLANDVASPAGTTAVEKARDWLETPLVNLPLSDARQFVDSFRSALNLARIAARRETCEWELQYRDQSFILIMLPEAQSLRKIGLLLALDARLKFAAGDRTGGFDTLRTGLALARHIASAPTFVNGLIGVRTAEHHLDVLRERLQNEPDNLYWALATLPTPFIDLKPGADFEQDSAFWVFPCLRNAATAERSPEQWKADWESLWNAPETAIVFGDDKAKVQAWKNPDNATSAAMLARAKAIVVNEGWSAEKIAGCSDAQLLVAGTAIGFEHFSDEAFKRSGGWATIDSLRVEAEDSNVEHAQKLEVVPIAAQLLPTITRAQLAQERLQRTIAALAILESLRNYAAKHDGQLPAKLADVDEQPIPNDPICGAPFSYAVADNVATLSAPTPKGRLAESWTALKWEIHINK